MCGRSGTAVRLIYDEKDGTCTGVLTADGSTHTADIVILANGAQIPTLIEAKDEVEASGSAVAVIELTPAEAEKYKDIPIIDDFEQGQLKSKCVTGHTDITVLLTLVHQFFRDHLSSRSKPFGENMQLPVPCQLQKQPTARRIDWGISR